MKKKRKIIEKDGKFYSVRGKELTRCSNTMTEAEFFSWIKSGIRRLTTRWEPKNDVLNENKRKYEGDNKRQKWEHQCSICLKWVPVGNIEIDHIIPIGHPTCFEDLGGIYERALCERSGFQKLCKECHKHKTAMDRKTGKG